MHEKRVDIEIGRDPFPEVAALDEVSNNIDDRKSRSQTPPTRRNSNTSQYSTSISKIPRYVRNATANTASNSNSNATSAVSSPVQRKLINKQQQNQRYSKHGSMLNQNCADDESVKGNLTQLIIYGID